MSGDLIPRSTEELSQIVREAGSSGGSYRIKTHGRWMNAGFPSTATATLALTEFGGVQSYAPGDLTISVGAATTLSELSQVTAEHNQWCPLFPWGDDNGSVGATIATATPGPFSESLGRPRDLVIGVDFVDGLGRIVSAGGRVVKNVAGFDLTRTMTGQWGTLGIITALHLRLRARPAVDESFTLALTAGADKLKELTAGPYAPMGIVEIPGSTDYHIRLGGNAKFVAASRAAYAALGQLTPIPGDSWNAVRSVHPDERIDRARQWKWDKLSTRLKSHFDPANILNPGLLGQLSEVESALLNVRLPDGGAAR